MPLSEAAPDALSKVYALSLYELADAEGGRNAIESTLGQLEDVVELARSNPQFAEFLSSRALSSEARAASMDRILKGRVSGLVHRFLMVVNQKGRLANLGQIVQAFDAMAQEKFGRIEVDVYTAQTISAAELEEVRKHVAHSLKKDVVAYPHVDANMIGGIKLRVGDQLVDGSVATRLRNLKGRLQEQGLASLRAKFGSILG